MDFTLILSFMLALLISGHHLTNQSRSLHIIVIRTKIYKNPLVAIETAMPLLPSHFHFVFFFIFVFAIVIS